MRPLFGFFILYLIDNVCLLYRRNKSPLSLFCPCSSRPVRLAPIDRSHTGFEHYLESFLQLVQARSVLPPYTLKPKALHPSFVSGHSSTNLLTRGAADPTNEGGRYASTRRMLRPLVCAIGSIALRSEASVLDLVLNLNSLESRCCAHACSFSRNTRVNGAHGFPCSGYSVFAVGTGGMSMSPGNRRSTLNLHK